MATKKRPKLTPLQEAWNKEIKRLRQFQRRAEKRGYTFEPDFIPERPKRITKKRLAELKARTAKTEYAKAKYTTAAGEVVSGTQGRKMERSAAAKKGTVTAARRKQAKTQERTEPEPVGAPDESVGEFHVVEQIIQAFGGIPAIKYGGKYQNLIDLETGKEKCVNLLLDEWDKRTDAGDGEAYAQYLRTIEGALAQEISQIIYNDSDQSTVDGHYSYIATLIRGESLTAQDMALIESAYIDGEFEGEE